MWGCYVISSVPIRFTYAQAPGEPRRRYVTVPNRTPDVQGSRYTAGSSWTYTTAGARAYVPAKKKSGWYFGKAFTDSYLVLKQSGLIPSKEAIYKLGAFIGGGTIGMASGGMFRSKLLSLIFNLSAGAIGGRLANETGSAGWFGIGMVSGAWGSRALDIYSDWKKLSDLWSAAKGLPGSVAESTANRFIDVLKEYGGSLEGPTPGESNWSRYGGW